MLLDEILETLNKDNPPEAEKKAVDAPEEKTAEKSRLRYSDDFWTRFSKKTEEKA